MAAAVAVPMPCTDALRICQTLSAVSCFLVPTMPAAFTCGRPPLSKAPPAKAKKQNMELLWRGVDHGVVSSEAALEHLSGQVRKYALNKVGCRILQKIAGTLPVGHAGALVDELLGVAWEMSEHKYGSRVVLAILKRHCFGEHTDSTTSVFIDEILESAHELMRATFGHLVICAILKDGTDLQRNRIAKLLRMALATNAQETNCSHVVANALKCCSISDREALAEELLAHDDLPFLAETSEGCRVIGCLTKLQDGWKATASHQLRANSTNVLLTRHGRRLMNDLSIATL